MSPQELQALQARIGKSFLQTFYPTDYRGMKNEQSNSLRLVQKRGEKLRITNQTTSNISNKLARVLNIMEKEIDDLMLALDQVQNIVSRGDFLLGDTGIPEAVGGISINVDTDFFKRKNRKERAKKAEEEEKAKKREEEEKAKKEEKKSADEEEKTKKEQAKEKAKVEEDAKLKEPESKAPETKEKIESKPEAAKPKSVVEKPAAAEVEGAKPKASADRASKLPAKMNSAVKSGFWLVTAYYTAKTLVEVIQAILSIPNETPRKEKWNYIYKLLAQVADDIGLALLGAWVGAIVAGAISIEAGPFALVPAIVGFIVGWVAGDILQESAGETLHAMTDRIVDYLYPATDEEKKAADLSPAESITDVNPPPLAPPSLKPAPEQMGANDLTPAKAPSTGLATSMALGGAQVPAQSVPSPSPVQAPPRQQSAARLGDPPPPLPPPDFAPYQPPTVQSPQSEMMLRQAEIQERESSPMRGGGYELPSGKLVLPGAMSPEAQVDMGASGLDVSGVSLSPIRTASGATTQVNSMLASNFQGFVNALEASGYPIKSIGGYNKRNIAGTNKPSYHSWGAAIDINPAGNPHTKDGTMITDMPAGVGGLAAQFGLGWGGNWTSSKDTMHFSAASSEGGSFDVDRYTGRIVPLAEGGVVSKPTLALIGEGGEPEYVVPHSKVESFANKMLEPTIITKKKRHTHTIVMPIYMN